jgi:signal transduction histidine kinase
MRTRFEATEDFSDLDAETSLCLYRVAQEALTNAGRHSAADDVTVKLARVNGYVQLSVRDNGAGFTQAQQTRPGLGLRSIDERVRLRHGTVTVASEAGQGTLVLVNLPVAQAERTVAAGLS